MGRRSKIGADAIEHRRTWVSRFRLQGYTVREIPRELARVGIVNPDTGKPYSHMVVVRDMAHIRVAWQEHYADAFNAHAAEELEQIHELRRVAWRQNDLIAVDKTIGRKAALLGLNAPHKVEATLTMTVVHAQAGMIAELNGLDPDEFFVDYVEALREKGVTISPN